MKFFIGLLIGIILTCLIADSHAVRVYIMSRESLVSFSDESLPVLNKILRDIWYSIDDLDGRVYDLENP